MGLTILERGTTHMEAVAGRFEDEVEEYASDELSELINQKRTIESNIDELERDKEDARRNKERLETEIDDIEQKLERLDESAALQENRQELRDEKAELEEAVADLNGDLKDKISSHGFVPLAMPLISETAEELDSMRERGVIPSELNNEFIESLLDAETCICGRPLEPGTDHYHSVESMQGDSVTDGVEQSAMRIIGHLNTVSDIENEFFEKVDEIISQRMDLHKQIEEKEEMIDDISTELQEMDETTESGESIPDLEAKREQKEADREELISEIGRIEERLEQSNAELENLKDDIEKEQDEKEEALLAKRRQKAAELVGEQLQNSFADLKGKVREWSNKSIQQTFGEIASKNMTAEITDSFELKIWQSVGDERVEVDKSTGERQIASLAFIGSLVKIARERYESDSESEYFTGGIYPLVMDSPFGALDKSHRREVSKVIPKLANQVVVFATDSQWEGPVQEEMADVVGQQYWLDFDEGDGAGNHPQTTIRTEQATVGGD
jgi:DNA sulfur modification protein DndD